MEQVRCQLLVLLEKGVLIPRGCAWVGLEREEMLSLVLARASKGYGDAERCRCCHCDVVVG